VSECSSHPFYFSGGGYSRFLIQATGTGISLYGRNGPGGGILNLRFDGEMTSTNLNSTDPGSNSTRLWQIGGLSDGDHQVIGSTAAVNGQVVANIWIDYFE